MAIDREIQIDVCNAEDIEAQLLNIAESLEIDIQDERISVFSILIRNIAEAIDQRILEMDENAQS